MNWKRYDAEFLIDENLLHVETSDREGEGDSWDKIEDKSWKRKRVIFDDSPQKAVMKKEEDEEAKRRRR